MENCWNLDKIYKGLDDPEYSKDVARLEKTAAGYVGFMEKLEGVPTWEDIESILNFQEEVTKIIEKLMRYVGLSYTVDTENGRLLAEENKLERMAASFAGADAKASKIIAKIPNLDEYCGKSEIIADYRAYLKRTIDEAKYLLSDREEELYSKMNMVGGGAWGTLQSFLTSTLKVDYKDKELTLSEVRNLAYDPDPEVRKAAFDAEIKSYDKVADSIAYALNNIKLQVNMISRQRGYESGLDEALHASRMSRATLDAMMSAISKHLPNIRKYFLKKAELLGYEGGLKWYDLFAPVGSMDKKYTIPETRELLINTFKSFTPEMSDLMKEAFDNEWIDFYPRKGKEGGAFDESLGFIDESRILTNFDGTFGAVDTLSHELGHAFHDRQVFKNRPMNTYYPMPVAETASTFNETHLNNFFLQKADSEEEKLSLLDGLLREQTQCIVDIYSRYLFETSVFEQCEESFLMKDDLNRLMLEAQKKAYGEGLDESTLHPYMWACKSHYYSTGLSFYNFPYAFGTLFAAGLYDMFMREGSEAFVPKYKAMLAATPTVSIEEAGALMGVDLTKEEFWNNSLSMIEKDIEKFVKIA